MQEWTAFAKQLVAVSSQIVSQYYQADIPVDTKNDGSPVTIADKKAEEAMRELIKQHHPTHGIIGEEFPNHLPEAAYQWTLDPIDGTKSFVTGVPMFGTLIGLMHNRQPLMGVLSLPISGQVLLGAAGQPTTLDGKPVSVRPCNQIESALCLSTTHWGTEKYHDMPAYERLTQRAKLYRTWGDCYGYYLVAGGKADIMVDAAVNIWDIVPFVPIIEGAGGTITDWYGNKVIDGKGAIATGGTIHDEVIAMLNPSARD